MRDGRDLLCLGRAAVDLYGEERGVGLEDAVWFRKSLGGSAANTAVAAARLGLRVAMLTRVGADPMGRFVLETLARERIDVSQVGVSAGHLTGLVVLALRTAEDSPHMFYRNDCADMTIGPDDVNERHVASARALLLTGTHLSTESTRAASLKAARIARDAGRTVVLDVDYRPSLWGAAAIGQGGARSEVSLAAVEAFRAVLPLCDVVVGTEDEIRVAAGMSDLEAAERALASGERRVVTKLGRRGARSREQSRVYRLDAHRVRVVNAVGAGDAFLGAYLFGLLRGNDPERCLALGNANGAAVAARTGCAPAMPTRSELERFMSEAPRLGAYVVPDDELHWRLTRPAAPRRLFVLAQDHRAFFESLCDDRRQDRERIAQLKRLIFAGGRAAFQDSALAEDETGFIIDADYGLDLLARERVRWVARPIEAAQATELEFTGASNVALELLRWSPRHTVKVKLAYHPGMDPRVLAQRRAKLDLLQTACRRLGRQWLLEVLPIRGEHLDLGALPEIMRGLYAAGLAPEWWKLPPPDRDETWDGIEAVLESEDPDCFGVLLLGSKVGSTDLEGRIARAGRRASCRGFAFGRTVFSAPAAAWFEGKLSDEGVVSEVHRRLADLIELWSTSAA